MNVENLLLKINNKLDTLLNEKIGNDLMMVGKNGNDSLGTVVLENNKMYVSNTCQADLSSDEIISQLVYQDDTDMSDSEDEDDIRQNYRIKCKTEGKIRDGKFSINLSVDNLSFEALLDSGANFSCVNGDIFRCIGGKVL